jgi:pyruvate/2-oxoglutarate dehydrogenase complex dihydrolipoamide dehydrogenase (E3) component
MAKVVVLKETNAVLGMHIASPNAGEIIQGFAVAFRKGLMYQVRAAKGVCVRRRERYSVGTKRGV